MINRGMWPGITITDGLSVSPISLGTVSFGTGLSEADCFAQLDRYAQIGNLIDTARIRRLDARSKGQERSHHLKVACLPPVPGSRDHQHKGRASAPG